MSSSRTKLIALWVPWQTPPKQTLMPYIKRDGSLGWYLDSRYKKVRKSLTKLIFEAFVREGYKPPISNQMFIKGIFFRDNFPCNTAELIGFITDAIENSDASFGKIIADKRQIVGHWGFIIRGIPDKEAGTYIEIRLDPPQPKLVVEVRSERKNDIQAFIASRTGSSIPQNEIDMEQRAIESAEEPI